MIKYGLDISNLNLKNLGQFSQGFQGVLISRYGKNDIARGNVQCFQHQFRIHTLD